MLHRNAIQGVLHNFLGTFTSRYTDYHGYWLFGMLTTEMENLQVELLNTPGSVPTAEPLATAVQSAQTKFEEQMKKASLPLSLIREAQLHISRSSEPARGPVNGHFSEGHNFTFSVRAVSDSNRVFEDEISVFIASHDPSLELRSARNA